MRIQVVFNNTPILVPCGDGKLTVGELMQKAIVRFKKLGNKVCMRGNGWGNGGFIALLARHRHVFTAVIVSKKIAFTETVSDAATALYTPVHLGTPRFCPFSIFIWDKHRSLA